MTYYKPGDIIVSRVTAQGMTKGKKYKVTDFDRTDTPFGSFVDYKIQPVEGGAEFWVGNLHLLSDKVQMSKQMKRLVAEAKRLLGHQFAASPAAAVAAKSQLEAAVTKMFDGIGKAKQKLKSAGASPASKPVVWADDVQEAVNMLYPVYEASKQLPTMLKKLQDESMRYADAIMDEEGPSGLGFSREKK